MNNLIHEATLYLQCAWEEMALRSKHVKIALQRFDEFYEELLPKGTVPPHLEKYIHKERMIYDMFIEKLENYVYALIVLHFRFKLNIHVQVSFLFD